MIASDSIPPDLDQAVRAELVSAERLLWVGVPDRRAYARAGGCLVPFGLLFAAFAAFSIAPLLATTDASRRPPIWFTLFGLPFFATGLLLAASPLLLYRKAANTVYALTDRRAMVIEGSLFTSSRRITKYPPRRLSTLTRVDRRAGSGDLLFDGSDGAGRADGDSPRRPAGFLRIRHVREVEKLVEQIADR